MKMVTFKNMSNYKIVLFSGQVCADPEEIFSAPIDNDVRFLVGRGMLKQMDKVDMVERKEARPEVLNKDTWDII